MNPSATIKMFLPHGDATRVRTAEISNWTGKAVAAPRTDLALFLAREELSRPGVYLLLGIDPTDGERTAYIGEAEVVSDRIKQQKAKEFWSSAIAFVSKDENLTKAHIRFLEGKLIEIAEKIGRYKLENSKASGSALPESDQSDMEVFLERIKQLLPVLGSELLTPIVDTTRAADKSSILYTKIKNAKASGERTAGGFVVFKGSTAVTTLRRSVEKQGPYIIDLKKKLLDEGALIEKGGSHYFTRDVEFSSPSAAGAVIHGGNVSGPAVWKSKSGKSLKELEEAG